MKPSRQRLDLIMLTQGLTSSRERARALIMAGNVTVDGQIVDKPGAPIRSDSRIEIRGGHLPYVSRGGLKLAGALEAFALDVSGWICMDVGASTGGFTDCLLQKGVVRVYAVDVGYGQLAWNLRQDPRVVVIERTNIRHMPFEKVNEAVDLVVIDASFISLKLVVPSAMKFLKPNGHMLPLIKPQFEVGKGQVGKGGIVREAEQHSRVIAELTLFFRNLGMECSEAAPSLIEGPKGNREFFMLLTT